MYSAQQLENAHQTDLRAVLQHFGYKQLAKRFFENPFRQEKNSLSFSVFQHSNGQIWIAKDLSTGKTWRVLELVRELKKLDFKEAIKLLLSLNNQYSEPAEYFSFQNENDEVQPLPTHKEATQKQINSLDYYLKVKRGISPSLAKEYLKYVQYEHKGKTYYSLWFANNSNGFAVRNSIFKACFVSSDITTIEKENFDDWIVFEGFMDLLSAITHYKKPFKANILVLNSTTNTQKGIDYILDKMTLETRVFCFLDNDRAGKEAFVSINEQFAEIGVFDYSEKVYGEKDEKGNYKYNDFNEFLTKNKAV
jgi:5S rRNA maturation endonuclease (ribonuclease M5)